MKTAVIIITMGKWEEYVNPFVNSIRDFEDCLIIVINNGSSPCHPIPETNNLIIGNIWESTYIDVPTSYAKAINHGLWWVEQVEEKGEKFDWVVISNDDVLLQDEFTPYLKELSTNYIYGENIHYNNQYFETREIWIDGWIYYVPRKVLEDVGVWDEKFQVAGFEDADYCFRASESGHAIRKVNLPFVHLKAHTRKTVENFREKRLENFNYLVEKHGLIRKKRS